jgi:hypothetical protein
MENTTLINTATLGIAQSFSTATQEHNHKASLKESGKSLSKESNSAENSHKQAYQYFIQKISKLFISNRSDSPDESKIDHNDGSKIQEDVAEMFKLFDVEPQYFEYYKDGIAAEIAAHKNAQTKMQEYFSRACESKQTLKKHTPLSPIKRKLHVQPRARATSLPIALFSVNSYTQELTQATSKYRKCDAQALIDQEIITEAVRQAEKRNSLSTTFTLPSLDSGNKNEGLGPESSFSSSLSLSSQIPSESSFIPKTETFWEEPLEIQDILNSKRLPQPPHRAKKSKPLPQTPQVVVKRKPLP